MKNLKLTHQQSKLSKYFFLPLTAFTWALAPISVWAAPSVNGTTISWPNDGWYQVQSADTYTTICEGTLSCIVEPGKYIVINHTTGERFANISADSNEGSIKNTSITVNGNMISWPDDGWYQVQNANNYSTVCEGGTSCIVQPGSYIVINHTNGERTAVDVPVNAEPENPIAPKTQESLSENSNQLIIKLAGYQMEQLGVLVDLLASEIIETLTAETLTGTQLISGSSQLDAATADIQRQRYSCPNGGTMIYETASLDNSSSSTNLNGYSFDQCNFTTNLSSLEAGNYELNGEMQTDKSVVSGSRFSVSEQQIEWTRFTLVGPSELSYAITGSANYSDENGANNTTRTRVADITDYKKIENGQSEELNSVAFSVSNESLNSGLQFVTTMSMSGTYQGVLSEADSISVRTIQTFERLRGVGPSISVSTPLIGEIEFLSDNGSVLYVTANTELHPTSASTVVLVDHNYTDEAGNKSVEEDLNLMINLAIWAADCTVSLDEQTSAANCVETESIVVQ